MPCPSAVPLPRPALKKDRREAPTPGVSGIRGRGTRRTTTRTPWGTPHMGDTPMDPRRTTPMTPASDRGKRRGSVAAPDLQGRRWARPAIPGASTARLRDAEHFPSSSSVSRPTPRFSPKRANHEAHEAGIERPRVRPAGADRDDDGGDTRLRRQPQDQRRRQRVGQGERPAGLLASRRPGPVGAELSRRRAVSGAALSGRSYEAGVRTSSGERTGWPERRWRTGPRCGWRRRRGRPRSGRRRRTQSGPPGTGRQGRRG